MIIDMHTHAGRPRRTGEVDRSVLATMRDAGVGRRRGCRDRRHPGDPPRSGDETIGQGPRSASRASAWLRRTATSTVSATRACASRGSRMISSRTIRPWCWRSRAATSSMATWTAWTRWQARGVRSIQLTHYLVNETGDIQTAPPVHGGLTRFGAEVVRRMNRIGVIFDVAHCSEDTVRGVVGGDREADPVHACEFAGAGRAGRRTSAVHQSGIRADGGGDRRRDRRLAVDADAGKSARHDPPHVPRDRRGGDRSCRHRHGSAGRRGAHRDAGFRAPSGTGGGVARSRPEPRTRWKKCVPATGCGCFGRCADDRSRYLEADGRCGCRGAGRRPGCWSVSAPARPRATRSGGWGSGFATGCGSPACRPRWRVPNWRARSAFRCSTVAHGIRRST